MFWRYTFGTSSITKLLEAPETTVKDLLEDGDFLSEVRSRNSKLIDYFATDERMEEMLKVMTQSSDEPDFNFRTGSITCDAICLDVPEWNRCFHHFPSLYACLWRILDETDPHPMTFNFVSRIIGVMATSNYISLTNYIVEDSSRIASLIKHIDLVSCISCFERMLSISEDKDRMQLYQHLVNQIHFLPLIQNIIIDTFEVSDDRRNRRSKNSMILLQNVFESLRQDFPPNESFDWTVVMEMQNSESLFHIVRSIHALCASPDYQRYFQQISSALELLLVFFDMERSLAAEGHQFVPHRPIPSYSWHYCFCVDISAFKNCVPILLDAYKMLLDKLQPSNNKRLFPNGKEVVFPSKIILNFLNLFAHIVIVECALESDSSASSDPNVSKKKDIINGGLLSERSAKLILEYLWDAFELYPENSMFHSLISVLTENLILGFHYRLDSSKLTTQQTENEKSPRDFTIPTKILRHITGKNADDETVEMWKLSKSYELPEIQSPEESEHGVCYHCFTSLDGTNRSQYLLTVLILHSRLLKRLVSIYDLEKKSEFITRSAHVRLILSTLKKIMDPSNTQPFPNKSYFNSLLKYASNPDQYMDSSEFSVTFSSFVTILESLETDSTFTDSMSNDPYGYGCDQFSHLNSISQSVGELQPEDLVSKFKTAFVEVNDVEAMLNEMQSVDDLVNPPNLHSLTVLCDVENRPDQFPPDPSTFIPKLPDISISKCSVVEYLRSESASKYPPLNPHYKYKESSGYQGDNSPLTASIPSLKDEKESMGSDIDDESDEDDKLVDPFVISGAKEQNFVKMVSASSSQEINDPFVDTDSVS